MAAKKTKKATAKLKPVTKAKPSGKIVPKKKSAAPVKKAAGKVTKPAAAKKKPPAAPKKPAAKAAASTPERWNLRLYVAGQTPRSITAFANLKRLCEERLAGRYVIEVIDLAKQPHLAQSDQIIAIPTLVRKLPEPIKRVVGDLSNIERVLVGMDLEPTPVN